MPESSDISEAVERMRLLFLAFGRLRYAPDALRSSERVNKRISKSVANVGYKRMNQSAYTTDIHST